MKRSEIVTYLEEVFENIITDDTLNKRGLAELVIERLLRKGMLPPNDVYTNSDDDFLLEHYNKWEPEDEVRQGGTK